MKKLDFIENQKSISTIASINPIKKNNIHYIIEKKKLNAKLSFLKTNLRILRKKNEDKKTNFNFEKIKELAEKSVAYKSCLILDKIKSKDLKAELEEEILRKNLYKNKMEEKINLLLNKLNTNKHKFNQFL